MLAPGRNVFEALGGGKGCCLLDLYYKQIIRSNAHSNESKNAHSYANRAHSNTNTKINTQDCQ